MSTHIALALHHEAPAGLAALADKVANGIDTSPLFKSTPSPVASALLRQTGAGLVAAGSKQQQAKHDAAAAA